jgi:hypothetical protein
MSLHRLWNRHQVLILLLCLFNVGSPPHAGAQDNTLEQPWKLLKEHRTHILNLSSDNEALTFHQTFMASPEKQPRSSIRRQPSRSKASPQRLSQEMQTAITSFWAAMATIGYIQEFRVSPEVPLSPHTSTERAFPSDTQRQWITAKPLLGGFADLMTFNEQLMAWPEEALRTLPPDHDFSQFSVFDDQFVTSPGANVDKQSWITLFQNFGYKGIEKRLDDSWQNKHSEIQLSVSEPLKQSSIQYYIETRLRPILYIHFLEQGIQTETQAYQVAWESWQRIQQRQQLEQTHEAMKRLCGTWKWVIHNHQNHGDHKATMTFIRPGDETPSQVQPSTILIHGDTVYLKWTFSQGIQEDSLLLSNHDARLEGTFTNSLGPYGSISGQRLSACPH